MNEVDYAESQIIDDGIPSWVDEDAHLHDFDYDEQQARIEEHKCEEEYLAHLILEAL